MMLLGRFEGSSPFVVTFTVHEPNLPLSDRIDRADELRFVKDGFSWWTALVPPLGFALKRLWWAALAYLVLVSGAVWALKALGVNDDTMAICVLALNIYLGFEVSSIERWFLDNKGWQIIGSVTGRNIADCERRFFESWLPAQPVISATRDAVSKRNGPGWPFGAKA